MHIENGCMEKFDLGISLCTLNWKVVAFISLIPRLHLSALELHTTNVVAHDCMEKCDLAISLCTVI